MTDKVYTGMTIEEMAAYMQSLGLRTEQPKSADNVLISSAGGWRFVVYLGGSPGDKVFTNVQLYSSHEDRGFTVGDGNDWNSDKRFAKSHCDKDGYPVIEYDFFIDGVTEAYLRRCFTMWEVLMALFMEGMGKSGNKTFVRA
jgi:hypothetical protein